MKLVFGGHFDHVLTQEDLKWRDTLVYLYVEAQARAAGRDGGIGNSGVAIGGAADGDAAVAGGSAGARFR